ncbi:hypothetical protein [Psychroflexus aestuariivivens]|nr:hypothetical protein [Psychroflexus aestuariivivens]
MAKIYLNESTQKSGQRMKPKRKTIDFILNYSKALKVISHKNSTFEFIQN